MTRYAIDADTAYRLIQDGRSAASGHSLVGPAALRSDVLSRIYRDARAGRLDDKEARALLTRLAGLKIRLLGDRVSRATAFRLAVELDADDTAAAEYLAVATLQADALVTDDPALAAAAEGRIPLAPYDDAFPPVHD